MPKKAGTNAPKKATTKKKQADVIQFKAPTNPTLAIDVDGAIYHLELGNMTYALEIRALIKEISKLEGADAKDGLDTMQEISDRGMAIIESAFIEPDVTQKLMGGRNRSNITRLLAVLNFILDNTTSQKSIDAMSASIEQFATTSDED
ncbi:hypothetical protein [Atopobium minutum]|uniref:hypothetical protein n=1 Tax=Atopobium minutum TaxID=1381 RepID=UPI00291156D5|nr:hypothetical protein [Atopobium minutum]MDU5130779.1 hypothetical protein [Atopobium minutum]